MPTCPVRSAWYARAVWMSTAVVVTDIGGAVDPHHLGAHIGQQHRAKRSRPDPGELDDFDPGQRSHVLSSSMTAY